MIVLDTNVISELFRPYPDARVIAWIRALTGDVAITAITLAELLAGVRRLPDGKRKQLLSSQLVAVVENYRDGRSILAFDEDAADHYARVLTMRERAGMPMSTADAQIAAICLAHDAVCATRNAKDFAHTGVEVIDPFAV